MTVTPPPDLESTDRSRATRLRKEQAATQPTLHDARRSQDEAGRTPSSRATTSSGASGTSARKWTTTQAVKTAAAVDVHRNSNRWGSKEIYKRLSIQQRPGCP